MHFPDFEREEIESRQRRARELMAEEELSVLERSLDPVLGQQYETHVHGVPIER